MCSIHSYCYYCFYLQRALLKHEIRPKFRSLCGIDKPVTDQLFGEEKDFKDALQESDLAAKVTTNSTVYTSSKNLRGTRLNRLLLKFDLSRLDVFCTNIVNNLYCYRPALQQQQQLLFSIQQQQQQQEESAIQCKAPRIVQQLPEIQQQRTTSNETIEVKFKAGNLKNNIEFWQSITHDNFVLNAIKGYRLEFTNDLDSDLLNIISNSHNSGDKNDLQLEIDKLLDLDIIEFASEENIQVVSPIFTVLKPNGSKRMILNLKRLNCHIKYRHFKMESIDKARELLSKDWFMASIDLEKAYHSIPIHSESRRFLKFKFHGQLYQYKTLPMGLSSAPYVFTRVIKTIFANLRNRGFMSVFYLDDSLLMAPSYHECIENVTATREILQEAGFTISDEKSVLKPTQCLQFLGFAFNTCEMSLSLPERKFSKLISKCQLLLETRLPTIQAVAQVIGIIISTLPVCPEGKLHYRALESCKIKGLITTSRDYNEKIKLTEEAKLDLSWWLQRTLGKFTTPLSVDNHYDFEVFSDASMTGYGFCFENCQLGGQWTEEDLIKANNHINGLELLAALKGLEHFIDVFKTKSLVLRCDNSTAMYYINNMGGQSSASCNVIAKDIWRLCLKHKIYITATFIAGVDNHQADALSRLNPNTEMALSDKAFALIIKHYGLPDIDLFASNANKKCDLYISWKRDLNAVATNAFTVDWSKYELIYCFPPFSLIGRVLQKANRESNKNMLIVYPEWPAQSWYPLLKKSVIKDLQLPPHNLNGKKIQLHCGLM